MQITDFNSFPESIRHGTYGGQAGNKDGILYGSEPWILKYPKSTRFTDTQNLSYVSSPLSEYIGSRIYGILGIPVYETRLGTKRGKIVVACRDFRKDDQILAEVRMIKNTANKELEELLDTKLHQSCTGDRMNLNELMLHLDHNDLLMSTPGTKERFWDMVVIDILIDNPDRNNGNWGILKNLDGKRPELAPVYDNGNAFSAKTPDERLKHELSRTDVVNLFTGGRTAYEYNGKLLSAKKMLKQDIPELQEAIRRNVPNIRRRMPEIQSLILEIPETYEGIDVCSDIRKQHYIKGMNVRLDALLTPAYQSQKNKGHNYGAIAEKRLLQFTDIHDTQEQYE